jgi:Domain of unknown function (DUF1906)
VPTPRRAVAAATSLIITLACLAVGSGPATALPPMALPSGQGPLAVQAAPVLQAYRALLVPQDAAGRRAPRKSAKPRRANSARAVKALRAPRAASASHAHRTPNRLKSPNRLKAPTWLKTPHGVARPKDAPLAPAPQIFTGQAFDTCTAPGLDVLQAWRHSSPYGAVGIYIGGRNRACSQPRLTPDWVRSASGLGWGLLPLYVGSQAPCLAPGLASVRIDPRRALTVGVTEGQDAVRAAGALGLAPSSPLYLDMEAYNRDGAGCSLAVLQYTAAWSQTVRAAGYLSGFYSSADAGIADLAAAALNRYRSIEAATLPDVIWYARWDARAVTDGYRALYPGQWADHRRVHQYQGNATEWHGGVSLCIDRNAVDAPVALLLPPANPAADRRH